ncbi:MAG: HPr-rel-A system PqqD family peptide chaperone [Burkholderiaceae bacterium]|nr:HPr-rel-A system PqqD family peptide chaperone [Burkholderiaceae bacterium]
MPQHPAGRAAPAPRFEATQGLRIVDLDDDRVVFEPRSWDAHLLNPAASAVLDLFLHGPQLMADIEAFLTDALDPAERGHAASHAERLVSELQSLGLVQLASENGHAPR